jgi:hypothetical protein
MLGMKETMKQIINYNLLAILLIGIFNCSSTRQPTLTEAQIEATFQKYQKEAYHPKRSFGYLKPQIDSITILMNTLINEPQFRTKLNFKTIIFYVLPSGKFIIGGYRFTDQDSFIAKGYESIESHFNKNRLDSTLNLGIENTINKFRTDSLPEYKSNLSLFSIIKTDSSIPVFSFIDSIYYSGLTGGRSKASIMKVVMEYLGDLKYAYNQRLREKPGLKGKITVKFAIDEFGVVIYCCVIDSTINDQKLENNFTANIWKWKFKKINKPGDVTEVIYPFVLSQ